MHKILWLTNNEFDTQRYTSRLVEVISHLQKSCEVQLVTSYAHEKVQPAEFHNKINCRMPKPSLVSLHNVGSSTKW